MSSPPNPKEEYDFIIVGAGPSGLALATRLSATASAPRVLLLEAGGPNTDAAYLVPSERFTLFASEPSLNWGYKTEPQRQLKGQEIDYSRGRGVGGSTAINFSCWVVGGADDYDFWAEKVNDDAWSWKNVKERLKKIEAYHDEIPDEYREWVNPKPEDHGTTGPLPLSYAPTWEKNLPDVFRAAQQTSLPLNPDINSGNPIGMGMGASTMYSGLRTTAQSYLSIAGPNFHLQTNSPVARIIFSPPSEDPNQKPKAIGVTTISGTSYFSKSSIILSAGALNTPQILLLSGLGPPSTLTTHSIPLIHSLPQIGHNLQDHCFSTATLLLKEGYNERMKFETDAEWKLQAKKQYEAGKGGKMAEIYCGVPMGFFKSEEVLGSGEFGALGSEVRGFLGREGVPSFEICTHVPPLYTHPHTLLPTDSYITALCFVMNPQSRGHITLRSSNPSDPPIIDPNLLSHPYDRRVMIEAMKTTLKLFDAPVFDESRVKMIGVPEGRGEEEIWEHVSSDLFSSWHMCSTVRMGADTDPETSCVDTQFRVHGVEGLRVADMSVCPLLPSNHTQSTAYLIGETAAEKIIAKFGL
ncbi:hypothetical protein CJF30_00009567 [Rutstroemia sp. NJR-2017a BBW]|nr:hypothetical protein CJF30_00009567 [Rutstroemia sp. NJR-2017a BBW]